jgi:hypothetical protein
VVLPLLNDLVGLRIGVGVVGLPEDFLVPELERLLYINGEVL